MTQVVVRPEEGKDTATVPASATVDSKGTVTVDSTTPVTPPASDKPVWEQHGFKSQDELNKAYGELRTKMSKDGAPKVETPTTPEAAVTVVKEAGLDMNALSREVAEKGELSAESLSALNAKGIAKETVDQFIAGQKAVAEKLTTEVQNAAGGKEQYGKMLDWAQVNLTDAQVEAFNKAIHSGDMDQAKLAVKGLRSDFEAAVGKEGKSVTGQRVPTVAGIEPFASAQEIVAAMSDPRYKNGDAAYIAKVEARLKHSKALG